MKTSKKMEDDLKKMKKEDDLNYFFKTRMTTCQKNGRQHQIKMEEDLKKIKMEDDLKKNERQTNQPKST